MRASSAFADFFEASQDDKKQQGGGKLQQEGGEELQQEAGDVGAEDHFV